MPDADIIVAGAGMVGCYIAKKLSDRGYSVTLLEKSKAMKEDSGIVSKRFFRHVPKKFAMHRIDRMQFVSPSKKTFSLKGRTFAWVVSRHEVNSHLRKQCKENTSYERILSVNTGKNGAEVKTDENTYSCRLIVGCDGTFSTVRRQLGGKDPRIFFGMLTRTKMQKGSVQVHLNKHYSPDFFGWIIPQTGEWGIMSGTNAKEHFDYFGQKENLEKGEVHGYPIPMGLVQTSYERAMIVGEAAGQTKPLTGGGYVLGLECARHAIKTADLCMQQGNFGREFIVSSYDRWRMQFAGEIKLQLLARKIYRRMTNKQIDKIFDILGPHAERVEVKDYDLLSKTFMQMPKTAIIKAGLQAIF
ncbi:MAG: NAD(P)-binding protein [Candidatus Aenigmarchaeota archaeon]|nr:NAD(P)-binding protein [Candidatus Aenigmarchaeota archaeon]